MKSVDVLGKLCTEGGTTKRELRTSAANWDMLGAPTTLHQGGKVPYRFTKIPNIYTSPRIHIFTNNIEK